MDADPSAFDSSSVQGDRLGFGKMKFGCAGALFVAFNKQMFFLALLLLFCSYIHTVVPATFLGFYKPFLVIESRDIISAVVFAKRVSVSSYH